MNGRRTARRPAIGARSLVRQVRYQVLLLLRSPSAPFFTLAVPFMLVVALDLVYGSRTMPTRDDMPSAQFYLPAMMAFAVVNACYTNVITGTTVARQTGILKRIRGTPLPGWVYLAGRVVSAGLVAVVSLVGVIVLSVVPFDAVMVWGTLPGTLVTVAAGIVCFSTVALALTPLVANTDAALPVAYGTILPLAFVSDVFFPSDTSPEWLQDLASAFPLRPLARALAMNLAPDAAGLGFHWGELGVLALWTVGAAMTLPLFRWEPSRHRSRRPRVQRWGHR